MRLKPLTEQEFKIFSNNFNYQSTYQSVEYAETINKQEYEIEYIGLYDKNIVVAASLILVKKLNNFFYAHAPRGFLIDYNDDFLLNTFTKEIKKYLGRKRVIAIKVSPIIYKEDSHLPLNNNWEETIKRMRNFGYYHLGLNNNFESINSRFEAVINLEPNHIKLFKNIKKNFRTKIRNAEKEGIRVYRGDNISLEHLYLQSKDNLGHNLNYYKDYYNNFDKVKKIDFFYAKLDTEYYLRYIQKLHSDYSNKTISLNNKLLEKKSIYKNKLITKKLEADKEFNEIKNKLINATSLLKRYPKGLVIATTLVTKQGLETRIMMDSYNKDYSSFNGKHLIIWKLIEKYHKEGYKHFNIGGITNPDLKNKQYQGLNQFKLNFNPNIREYIGDFELITNLRLYNAYRYLSPVRKLLNK